MAKHWAIVVLWLCVCGRAWGAESRPGPEFPVRPLSIVDVKDFGAETVRIGDLNDDGGPDLLLVQSVFATREITCLTAVTVFGKVLWQVGKASAENGRIYSDLPVQIYDWDDDGRNEVLYVQQAKYVDGSWDGQRPRERAERYEGEATMLVLDAATGREKRRFGLPAPADDSFLFADLAGRGRRQDLVVKDRYWNLWGVGHDGAVLWHWQGATGHFPALMDVDQDGRDEVFTGFALLDHDGKALFSRENHEAHADACTALKACDGKWRLVFGNGGLHCLTEHGEEYWNRAMGEAQHVVAGRFRPDSQLQLVAVDRTPEPSHRRDGEAWAVLYLFDLYGKEIWRRQQEKGAWAIAPLPLHWDSATGPQSILVYGQGAGRPAVLYNGQGEIVAKLPMRYSSGEAGKKGGGDFYALAADVWGDGREEVILFGAGLVRVYESPRGGRADTLQRNALSGHVTTVGTLRGSMLLEPAQGFLDEAILHRVEGLEAEADPIECLGHARGEIGQFELAGGAEELLGGDRGELAVRLTGAARQSTFGKNALEAQIETDRGSGANGARRRDVGKTRKSRASAKRRRKATANRTRTTGEPTSQTGQGA